jgi:hypothetical protein
LKSSRWKFVEYSSNQIPSGAGPTTMLQSERPSSIRSCHSVSKKIKQIFLSFFLLI